MSGSAEAAASAGPGRSALLEEVLEGLRRPQKELSPRWFYDRRGSELFEEITRLDEYYQTRTERALLERWAEPWVAELGPAALVELGAGSATKTRVLLDAMRAAGTARVYVPLDVSAEFLEAAAEGLRREYPELTVRPQVADMTREIALPELPRPALFALLGGTLGNFDDPAAVRLLARVAGEMGLEDAFLLGADLRPGRGKSVARLEAAYDDARGVTAAFNRNALRVLNREVGADFDPDAFRHRAFYDEAEARIEMHLVAEAPVAVTFGDGSRVTFREGESVRTEISCKYDRPSVEHLFRRAGMALVHWAEDGEGYFALALGAPAAGAGS